MEHFSAADVIQSKDNPKTDKGGVSMKKILTAILTALVLQIFSGCGNELTLVRESSELDGVTVTIEKVEIEKNRAGSTIFQPRVRIENNAAEGVMEVSFNLICLDKKGNELETFHCSYNGQDRAIAPGETLSYDVRGFQKVLDGEAAAMSVRLTGWKSETELPPIHLPQPGERLREALSDEHFAHMDEAPPIRLTVRIDRGGWLRQAVFEEPKDLATALAAFDGIRIGEETYSFVTDNYNGILLDWPDGESTYISLNLYSLEIYVYRQEHLYSLEGLGTLLSLATDRLEDVTY